MAIRSFLAFNLPADIRSKVSQVSRELKRSSINARWVNLDNIHLTIVFMGDVPQEDIIPIRAVIGDVCAQYHAFDISLNGIGVFPDRRRPRVVWLGLDGDIERMSWFRDELQDRLEPFNIKPETRSFRPHITLGRFRKQGSVDNEQQGILSAYKELQGAVGQLNKLIMFKSDLKPDGAVYSIIDSWPLS